MCEADRDCDGAMLCYTNVTWTDVPFCGCSHFYGGAGTDCEELSTQSYINSAIVGTGMVMILVVLSIEIATDCTRAFLRYRVFAYDNTVRWLLISSLSLTLCDLLTMYRRSPGHTGSWLSLQCSFGGPLCWFLRLSHPKVSLEKVILVSMMKHSHCRFVASIQRY